jgi:protoheme ferro-lyase
MAIISKAKQSDMETYVDMLDGMRILLKFGHIETVKEIGRAAKKYKTMIDTKDYSRIDILNARIDKALSTGNS